MCVCVITKLQITNDFIFEVLSVLSARGDVSGSRSGIRGGVELGHAAEIHTHTRSHGSRKRRWRARHAELTSVTRLLALENRLRRVERGRVEKMKVNFSQRCSLFGPGGSLSSPVL